MSSSAAIYTDVCTARASSLASSFCNSLDTHELARRAKWAIEQPVAFTDPSLALAEPSPCGVLSDSLLPLLPLSLACE